MYAYFFPENPSLCALFIVFNSMYYHILCICGKISCPVRLFHTLCLLNTPEWVGICLGVVVSTYQSTKSSGPTGPGGGRGRIDSSFFAPPARSFSPLLADTFWPLNSLKVIFFILSSMEWILGYSRFVWKIIILLIVRISTLFVFHNLKKFPPAHLFHPARLIDSWEYIEFCTIYKLPFAIAE